MIELFVLPSGSLFEIGAQTDTQACRRLRLPSHRSAKICDRSSPLSIKYFVFELI